MMPAHTSGHPPTFRAFSLMAWLAFSLCHDAFIRLAYSPFSTVRHLSHLCSLTVISQVAKALEYMEAVFPRGFTMIFLLLPLAGTVVKCLPWSFFFFLVQALKSNSRSFLCSEKCSFVSVLSLLPKLTHAPNWFQQKKLKSNWSL